MCQNELAGSPPVWSGQSWLSADTPALLYQPLSQAGAPVSGCSSEHVGEQGCLYPQAGSPSSFCALCRSWCAVEPRFYTNTHLLREDHQNTVQILF